MASLTSAHLQRRYTLFVVGILIVSAGLFVGVLMFGQSSATIVVTPRPQDVSTDVTLSIDNSSSATALKGVVTSDTVSATVTAAPSATGTPVDAHATGIMTVINTSTHAQPLAAGTRFRATNGQIVRSQNRIDVNPGQEVTVKVTADALGVSGNLEPGKFVIVALWSGLQDTIYGQLKEAMTGGQTLSGATLDLPSLTKASDEAVAKLNTANASGEGTLVVLAPKSVLTNPKTTTASSTYQVTVTMTRLTITYTPDELRAIIRTALEATITSGLQLVSVDSPSVTLQDQTDPKHPTVKIHITGRASIEANLPALEIEKFAGQKKDDVQRTIAALPGVAGVAVTMTPSWRNTLPSNRNQIHLTIAP